MHALPTPGVNRTAWQRLASAVRRSGPDGLYDMLGSQLYPVPNISRSPAEGDFCPVLEFWSFLLSFVQRVHYAHLPSSARADCITICCCPVWG
jgi:hypothetical protein